jgi:segregation and condensation protein A
MNEANPTISNQCESSQLNRVFVRGKIWTEVPQDLYIPPNALKVLLETFEGPLDLLLYLIKRQNLDILDIPIAKITNQYMEYIDLMKELQIELAAEYLVMAAMLAEIKSRMLLPKHKNSEEIEDDPRAILINRLQAYESYKLAAQALDEFPRQGRDIFAAIVDHSNVNLPTIQPKLEIDALIEAFKNVLQRAHFRKAYTIPTDTLSVNDRMSQILERLQSRKFVPFQDCCLLAEGRLGIAVSFLAILELFRNAVIEVIQASPFEPIFLKLSN